MPIFLKIYKSHAVQENGTVTNVNNNNGPQPLSLTHPLMAPYKTELQCFRDNNLVKFDITIAKIHRNNIHNVSDSYAAFRHMQ